MATIFELIDQGDADGIRALVAADSATRDLRNDAGLSPLMHAAYQGRGPAFAAILEAGEPSDPWDRLIGGYADGLPAPDAWTSRRLHTAPPRSPRRQRPGGGRPARGGSRR